MLLDPGRVIQLMIFLYVLLMLWHMPLLNVVLFPTEQVQNPSNLSWRSTLWGHGRLCPYPSCEGARVPRLHVHCSWSGKLAHQAFS